MNRQLALQFDFQPQQTFASFYPAGNQEILEHLKRFAQYADELQIYLLGESGMGKTHLLQACCQMAGEQGKSIFYYDLKQTDENSADLFEGLESIDLVCLDNIECISGMKNMEQALFNFYNRHRDQDKQLLLAANCPPRYLPFQLPDLKTRMSWGLTLKLTPPDDDQLIEAFKYKAHALGFNIPNHIGNFLKNHYRRDLPGLWQLLDKIDRLTLTTKRKITLPQLKQLISDDETG